MSRKITDDTPATDQEVAFQAIQIGAVWKLKLYLEAEGNPNATRAKVSLLHYAASLGLREAIFMLLWFGANPMLRDKDSRRPLHLAVLFLIEL